ncbi:DUF192 domain-containing protein [Rubrobacter marinus]|uniref:DUF192 domain-containing protein n=1 Tax=Rubrobacter marinus TaxID=2653852 RepID=A0A6G8PZT3_9ACTN|nr:DUF192 domain-containing protein [Rubrobacter marinus]QIN79716.1 DUF192 domain-containing protein [Rubrobacter marinus]
MRTRATLAVFLISLLAAGCGGGREPAADRAPEGTSGSSPRAGTTQGMETTQASTLATATVTLVPSDGGEPVEVRAEIADDDAERTRGLMERTALAEEAGMLFVFGRERTLSFWMRNTLIPLSIAYIDAEGRIVDIEDMEPLDDQTKHPSAEPAKYALEVNQGFFGERGIEVGDRVEGLPAGPRP